MRREILEMLEMGEICQEILEEKRGHGDSKIINNILKDALKNGLIKIKDTSHGFLVQSLVDDSQHLIHRGETSFHHLRRFLQKLEKLA